MDGSDCFHEVMTVPLIVQARQRAEHGGEDEGLEPAAAAEHLGTTATLVNVNAEAAWLAMRIMTTRSQYPLTTVNIQVATPITMRLLAM